MLLSFEIKRTADLFSIKSKAKNRYLWFDDTNSQRNRYEDKFWPLRDIFMKWV